MLFTRAQIERSLALDNFDGWDAQLKMTPAGRPHERPQSLNGVGRVGAVLLLLYPHRGELHLVLTQRRDDLSKHAGQVSFPGGRQEAGESLFETALRETEEEVGVPAQGTVLLGRLSSLYIPPSDFTVHPFVGWRDWRPHFRPAPAEVAELLEVPLRHLLDPATRVVGEISILGHMREVPYYRVGNHQVWGATAMMLSEFLYRLRHTADQPLTAASDR